MLETILSGPTQCLSLNQEAHAHQRHYGAQFALKNMTKDLRFILQTADETGAAVPAGHMVFQLYRAAMGRAFRKKITLRSRK